MPASASPVITLVTTPFTLSSRLFGVTVRPAFFRIVAAPLPHGTVSAHSTTMFAGLARSASVAMPFGLPLPTMISKRLRATITGSPAFSFASVSFFMLLSSAEMNTSAGAPLVIWVTRSLEPAKLNVTFAFGFAAVNASPISLNASVSDDAANTTTAPLVLLDAVLDEPHAARRPMRARGTRVRGMRRIFAI